MCDIRRFPELFEIITDLLEQVGTTKVDIPQVEHSDIDLTIESLRFCTSPAWRLDILTT